MKNILTIYKFNFPFLVEELERAKYDSICDDIRERLMYLDLFISKKVKDSFNYEACRIDFNWWVINIIYKKSDNWYFIPKFELNLYTKKQNNVDVINNIIKSIDWLWQDEYIFDILDENNINKCDDIIKISNLEYYFTSYSESKLEEFIKSINKDYLEDNLNNNIEIKYSFYYLLYLLYIFYKNYIESKEQINELEYIIKKEDRPEFKNNLIFSERKLENLNNLNLVTFKKYKSMLDKLFELLK